MTVEPFGCDAAPLCASRLVRLLLPAHAILAKRRTSYIYIYIAMTHHVDSTMAMPHVINDSCGIAIATIMTDMLLSCVTLPRRMQPHTRCRGQTRSCSQNVPLIFGSYSLKSNFVSTLRGSCESAFSRIFHYGKTV